MTIPIVPGPFGPYAILIEGGAPVTSVTPVSLLLNAVFDEALEMIVSESNVFASGIWEPYQTFKNYSFLDSSNGTKTVFVKFRVQQADLSYIESAIYSASIELDSTPPAFNSPPILINAGAVLTRNQSVNVSINVSSPVVLMQVINELDYTPNGIALTAWIPFNSDFSWTLSPGNGEKRVYVRLRDTVGNTTSFVSAGISLNSTLPQAPVITSPLSGSVVNQRIVKVTGTAEPGAIVTVTVKPIR